MPPSSHRSLEELARRYVPGAGPVDLQPLAAGVVNESWRVLRAGRSYVLRLDHAEPRALGLDREWECRVAALAAGAGVGPTVRCCEPAAGILVSDWMPGRTWSHADVQEAANIDAMAQLLRRVHALRVPQPARCADASVWIAFYSTALAARGIGAAAFGHSAAAHLARAVDAAPTAVLCHSDLHRFNVAVGARPVLLDWEYAHVADPYWDLAGWIANNDGDTRFALEFLSRYLGRPAAAAEAARLASFSWLYDYVCYLWSELYLSRSRAAAAASVAARAGQLAARLSGAAGGRVAQLPAH